MPRLLPLALAALALAGCADPAETDAADGPAGEPVEDGAILGDGVQEDEPLLEDEPVLEGDAADEAALDDL